MYFSADEPEVKMSIAAIIAEYNPLHNGHIYQIERVREITGCDNVLIVMSGNFVQRGTPSVCDKNLRTKAALLAGADAVIELPVYYSTASAEYFAQGAVSLIDKLGCVDYLCFGSECGDIDLLYAIAEIAVNFDDEYHNYIKEFMGKGFSYAKAECEAIISLIDDYNLYEESVFDGYNYDRLVNIMSSPNNTLAICYLKALALRNSTIKPVSIKRVVSEYNDDSLYAYSSSAVRKELESGDLAPIKSQMPSNIYSLMECYYNKSFPITNDDFSEMLLYKLLSVINNNGNTVKSNSILSLCEYVGVTKDLAARIINNINNYISFSQFVALLKTKDSTYASISRGLIHILLNIKVSNLEKYILNDYSVYARILGFNANSSVLNAIKNNSTIPVISKLADAEKIIKDPIVLRHFNENMYASDLYYRIVSRNYNEKYISEYSIQQIILN